MLKILIVNDKYGIAEKMGKLIAGMIAEDIEVEILPGIETTRDWLKLHPEPDIIFMDVHIRSGISFDLFRYLKIDCPIIFTAENDYVSCMYKMRTSHYMLNMAGEDPDEYPVALSTGGILQRQYAADNLLQVITGLKTRSQPSYKEKFIVNVRNNWIPVNTRDIACFTRRHLNYLYTFSGEKYLLDYGTLEDIEKLLNPQSFYRANRQTIVNIDAIGSMKPLGNQKIILILKDPLKMEVDVSREKAPFFKRWFDR
jgi:DNA-binding LytR/AlgR family response regulator